MNSILRGVYSGLAAGVFVAVLYFVDYGPGNDLNRVAGWFGLNGQGGKLIGFGLLIVLGGLFGLVFGLVQRDKAITFSRAVLTGLALGAAYWVIFPFGVAMLIGHMSLAQLNLGTFLYAFVLCLVYGFLLGAIYIQSTMGGKIRA
ncbi:MAG: hypothetical protein NVSMB27_05860 [Ktedonobacteraceae bacterium]